MQSKTPLEEFAAWFSTLSDLELFLLFSGVGAIGLLLLNIGKLRKWKNSRQKK